jgi:undecaprenyl-diphosphatase
MELSIVEYLNHVWFGWVNPVTVFVSNELFLIILWTLITLAILFLDKRSGKKVLLAVVIALILHFSISEGFIKHFLADYFFRIRPYIFDHSILPLGKLYADSSFPSSHMASTLAVLSVYFYYYRKFWPVMGMFVLFMAFARMHDGMHYPSDVLAGSTLGIVDGVIAIYFVNKFYSKIWKL